MLHTVSVDEVDTVVPTASAPAEDEIEQTLKDTQIGISTLHMTSAPTAPVLDDMPCIISG